MPQAATVEVQQVIDNVHQQYRNIIQMLTQQNAELMAVGDQLETENAELRAKVEALEGI